MELLYLLSDQMSTYYNATDISLQLLDASGEVIDSYGTPCGYCTLFQEACGKFCPCGQSHMHACREAVRLGEGYMFSCPAGLMHFAVAVVRNGRAEVNILAGPVALEYPDMDKIDSIIKKYNLSLNYRTRLYQSFSSAPLVEPYRARYLCKLLSQLVGNFVYACGAREEEKNSSDIRKEKVGEYMELVRQAQTQNSWYDMEKQLIEDVMQCNKKHAKSLLNEMLGRIYFTSGNNIEIIKTRSIELIAILSRVVTENGESGGEVYRMTDAFLRNISDVRDLTELSYLLLETLDLFCNVAFSKYKKTDVPSLRKALDYISEHYTAALSLEEVAEFAGLNPSYFSALFKKEMGINFSNYVTQMRMEQAKHLLKSKNTPLVEIAMSLGYENQSYFSSVFKKYCGMTPKEFRHGMEAK